MSHEHPKKGGSATSRPGLAAPLKWHGGKHYLAKKLVALMPRHLNYAESYFGGGAVLFARDPEDPSLWLAQDGPGRQQGVSEVVNDLNSRLMNFWRVLRDEELFAKFRSQVEALPLARAEWWDAHAHEYGADPVADAVAFSVHREGPCSAALLVRLPAE